MTRTQATSWSLILAVAILGAALAVAQVMFLPPMRVRFSGPIFGSVFIFASGILITLAIAVLGGFGDVLVVLYSLNLFGFYYLRGWTVVLGSLAVPAEYGLLLLLQQGHHDRLLHWLLVALVYWGVGIAYAWIARTAEDLMKVAEDARSELAKGNAELESRVAQQVAELEAANRFRRFLPAAVAEVVASNEALALSPHRRKIAVFFCDLRGFTAFTNSAEPEDVMAVLDEYFAAVGAVLAKHGATIGAYTGDGLMAFFGDPLPTDSPARSAVEMVHDLSTAMAALVERWRSQDFDIHHSAAIALGHATLGVVGTDERSDYTALGAVVNLSARLCAQAAPGQVLLDRATHLATNETHPSREAGKFDLKGFDSQVHAYELE